MNRGLKFVIFLVIFLAVIFATSSGFFYAKNISLEKEINTKNISQNTKDKNIENLSQNSVANSNVTTPVTTTPVETTSLDSRPSSPTDTVVVEQGETLFAIGQKTGVPWIQIAEANGIDADKIKIGQTLIIPKNNQISFTLNKAKATSLQSDVTNGKYQFRLMATETAKADAAAAYGLVSGDTYTQTKIDLTAGLASVTVVKADKSYTVTLIQPATKGEKGIWAIESIKKN